MRHIVLLALLLSACYSGPPPQTLPLKAGNRVVVAYPSATEISVTDARDSSARLANVRKVYGTLVELRGDTASIAVGTARDQYDRAVFVPLGSVLTMTPDVDAKLTNEPEVRVISTRVAWWSVLLLGAATLYIASTWFVTGTT